MGMFRVIFLQGPMSSTKTTALLADRYDHQQQGINTMLLTPKTDTRGGVGTVASRLGVSAQADMIITGFDEQLRHTCDIAFAKDAIIYIDECQFLDYETVKALVNYCHQLSRESHAAKTYFKIMAYGLLKDFRNQLFSGSKAWLEEADKVRDFETNCKIDGCDRKATCNYLKQDLQPNQGNTVIGDGEFISVCEYHYHMLMSQGGES